MLFQAALVSAVLFLMLYSHIPMEALLPGCLGLCLLLFLAGHGRRHTHGAFLSIDHRAYKSRMSRWSTGLKGALAAFCAFACIAADSAAVSAYLIFCMLFLTVAVGRTPLSYYASLMALPMGFILLSCLVILLEVSPEPFGLLSIPLGGWYLCITETGQRLAFRTMLRALGAVGCLYMLSLSTPVYRIIAALRSIRVPAVVAELMYLIYRYLFILLETHQNMAHASASRLGYRDWRTSLGTLLKNAFRLLFVSLRQTSDMLLAMESRCYDGEIRFYTEHTGPAQNKFCCPRRR